MPNPVPDLRPECGDVLVPPNTPAAIPGDAPASHSRGARRRAQLVQAGIRLLGDTARHPAGEMSLSDVASAAGIPPSSAYHFFPGINRLFVAITRQSCLELAAIVARPYLVAPGDEWGRLFALAVERVAGFHKEHPAMRNIALTGLASYESRFSHDANTAPVAQAFLEALDQHFHVPPYPDLKTRIQQALRICDLLLMDGFSRAAQADSACETEARRAGLSYLRMYLPEHMPGTPGGSMPPDADTAPPAQAEHKDREK